LSVIKGSIYEARDGLLFGLHKPFTDYFEIRYSTPEQEVVGQFGLLVIFIRAKLNFHKAIVDYFP